MNGRPIKETYKIRSTTNYDQFKFIDGNRDVKHAAKIKRSIEAVGLLVCPVLCNENMEIIDGQGRFTACKELRLPVYYVVQDGLTIEDVRKMNSVSSNWTGKNYVHSYAHGVDARDDYKYLESLQKQFPMFGIPVIMAAITKTYGGSYSKTVNDGRLHLSDSEYLKVIQQLSYVSSFVEFVERIEGKGTYMYNAINFAYTDESINNDHLLSQFKKRYPSIRPIATMMQSLDDLESVYNHNLRNGRAPADLVSHYKAHKRAMSAANRKGVDNAAT